MRRPFLILMLLWTVAFSLAVSLNDDVLRTRTASASSGGLLEALLGQSRRLFASHFFLKADVYFHSGYYPSIFDDQTAFHTPHMALYSNTMDQEKNARAAAKKWKPVRNEVLLDDEAGSPGLARTWIDEFGRNFYPVRHTHLDQAGRPGEMRELLPWLRLAAELDPHRTETFVVTAYWLRTQLHKPAAAEEFLREGQRLNPHSPDILYELGRIYAEHHRDAGRARNLLELALLKWNRTEAALPEPNVHLAGQILGHLARLEEQQGNHTRALRCWQLLEPLSPAGDSLRQWIATNWNKVTEHEATHTVPPDPATP